MVLLELVVKRETVLYARGTFQAELLGGCTWEIQIGDPFTASSKCTVCAPLEAELDRGVSRSVSRDALRHTGFCGSDEVNASKQPSSP